MPGLSLLALTPDDLDDLSRFEHANRAFFEAHVNARPPAYYAEGGIQADIAQAVREAAEDQAYQFLLRDATGVLVGRVNLTRVRRTHFHSAELGYRIAHAANGRGHATEAVRLVLQQAFGCLGLRRVEATAAISNTASCAVLRRNGFVQFGHSRRSFELAGRWHDLLHFECHALQEKERV